MSPDKPIPPNRVKAIRLNLGMSQDKLSELSGVTQTTISHAENHRYAMSGRTTLAIARVFQMPVGDLYLRDDPRSESGNDLFSKARADRVSESKGTDERSIFNVSVSLTRGEFLELVSSLACRLLRELRRAYQSTPTKKRAREIHLW